MQYEFKMNLKGDLTQGKGKNLNELMKELNEKM